MPPMIDINIRTVVLAAGVTAITTGLGALPFLFVLAFEPFLPVGFGLAAGAMLWMVFAELIPDALQRASGTAVGTAATLAFTVLLAFQRFVLP